MMKFAIAIAIAAVCGCSENNASHNASHPAPVHYAAVPPEAPEAVAPKPPPANDGDFRGHNWGASPSSIGLSDGDKISNDPATYVNINEPCAIPDRKCNTARIFVEGEFAQGMLMFFDSWTDKQKYIADVHEFTGLLSGKYGAPSARKDLWTNDLYQSEPTRHGFAMSMGYLTMIREWRTDRTIIRLVASGDNFEVRVSIGYFSKSHEGKLTQSWTDRNSRGL